MFDNWRNLLIVNQNPRGEDVLHASKPELVPLHVAGSAEPFHVKRAPIIVVMHLRFRIAALTARLLREVAPALVDVGVATCGILPALRGRHRSAGAVGFLRRAVAGQAIRVLAPVFIPAFRAGLHCPTGSLMPQSSGLAEQSRLVSSCLSTRKV